ncbi:MAG TPA: quinolinate synthase NadA [Candidatus Binataceae bacterium]|jgi:quinolinate synthase|nr:quinolinate synthase NadA [Candidatus Binataceae bacterium]
MEANTHTALTGDQLYDKLSVLGQYDYDRASCQRYASIIDEIHRLKEERGAVILAHNYQRPEIFEVADFIGDSLELARKARDVRDAQIIVFCGVHFMAETAKVFNPERMVLLPDLKAGCSLADSVTAEALAERKAELSKVYPDLKVVSYVNCTADVKALSDACCTSANASKIVNAIDSDHVLFVPDQNLANYVQGQTRKQVISWDGNCYVHHQITAAEVEKVKRGLPGVKVLAHPECRSDVLGLADAVLSTSAMVRYAEESDATEFLIVTECGLSDRLLLEIPGKHFYKACKLCRYMKMITLEGTLDSLRHLRYEIELSEEVREGARQALERMLELSA